MSTPTSTPAPWRVSAPPSADLAHIFATLDRQSESLTARHPNLLIPGTGVGGYIYMGPFTARALGTLWSAHAEWFAGHCPVCSGPARAIHATGLLTVGGLEGICLSCGVRLIRTVGGIVRILALIPERLQPAVRSPRNLNPRWELVLRVLGRLGETDMPSAERLHAASDGIGEVKLVVE